MLAGLLRVLSDPVPVIPRADVPGGLQAVLERAMAKTPSERWPSAGEFGRALQSVERQAGWPVTRMPVEEVHETRVSMDGATNPGPGALPAEEMTAPGLRPRIRPAKVDNPPPTTLPTGPASPYGLAASSAVGDQPALTDQRSGPERPDEQTRHWSWPRGRPAPDAGPTGPPRSKRPWMWMAAAGGLVVVGLVIAIVLTTGSPAHRIAARQQPRLQTPSAALAAALAPRQVQVTNEQPTSVTIEWVDPSNGQYPFVVRVSNGVIQTAASHTQAVVTGLDPAKGYCFVVGAVYGVGGQVANAGPVCVRGGTM